MISPLFFDVHSISCKSQGPKFRPWLALLEGKGFEFSCHIAFIYHCGLCLLQVQSAGSSRSTVDDPVPGQSQRFGEEILT